MTPESASPAMAVPYLIHALTPACRTRESSLTTCAITDRDRVQLPTRCSIVDVAPAADDDVDRLCHTKQAPPPVSQPATLRGTYVDKYFLGSIWETSVTRGGMGTIGRKRQPYSSASVLTSAIEAVAELNTGIVAHHRPIVRQLKTKLVAAHGDSTTGHVGRVKNECEQNGKWETSGPPDRR